MNTILLTTISIVFCLSIYAQTTHYVDTDATGSNNGSNWANAYTDLQSALGTTSSGDEIWVAAGTYYPTSGTDRTISFEVPSGVKVYGGFAGVETLLSQRDYTNNTTTLSGDIGTGVDDIDNSYHVVKFANAASTTILDGFTITKGYADGGTDDTPNACGGGIYNDGSGSGNSSNPQITNCIITDNYAYYQGGGVHNEANVGETEGTAGESSPTFTNCDITYNRTNFDGAGVNNEGEFGGVSSPTFTDCTISNNTASDDGGGVYNHGEEGTSSPTFNDCTISNNTANGDGGGVYNDGFDGTSSPTFTDCTISNNTASNYGGGVYNHATETSGTAVSSGTFTGSIISGNEGSYGGGICNYGEGGTASPTFSNCNINNNTAYDYGGGVYNEGYGGYANPEFTNCTFDGNDCDYDGGAMYNLGYYSAGIGDASPTIDGCTFINNTAGYYEYGGGAIQNYGSGGTVNPIVKNTIFQNNSTTGFGGAISQMSYDLSTVSPQFINCLFIDNTAEEGGGAFYDYDYDESHDAPLTTDIINCTFSNNGDIAYWADYTGTVVTIKNSIFWDNPDGELSATNGAVINASYSDIEGGYTGTGNINSDPLFADAANDDYRLYDLSPCVDEGENGANSEDNDIRGIGFGRKLNKTTGAAGTIDMGAYEFQAAPSIPLDDWAIYLGALLMLAFIGWKGLKLY